MQRRLNGRKRNAGVSLIEVLVSVLVLSIGLLGLAGLQISAMQHSASAYLRSQASLLSYSLIDLARASGGTIDTTDLSVWQGQIGDVLPNGSGSYSISGTQITVTVTWYDAHWKKLSAESEDESMWTSFQVKSAL